MALPNGKKTEKKLKISCINLIIYVSYGQVKKEKQSAKANGLTTQCDKKRVLLNFKKWRPEPTQKNGA